MNILKEASLSGETKQSKGRAHSTAKTSKRRIPKFTQAIMSANDCSRSTAERKIKEAKTYLGFKHKKGVGYTTEEREAILAFVQNSKSTIASLPTRSSRKAITPESSFEDIRDDGRIHHEKTTEHALAFCGCVAALKAKCGIAQGGSDFGKRALEYWGLGRSAASRALTIGTTLNFPKFGKVLPSSMSALEAIAKMPDERLEECVKDGSIKPGITAKDVSNLIRKKVEIVAPTVEKSTREPNKIAIESVKSSIDDRVIDVPVIAPPDDPEAVEVTLIELQSEDEHEVVVPPPVIVSTCDHSKFGDFSSNEKRLLIELLGAIGPEMLNDLFDDADAAVITGALPKLADLLGGAA